MNNPLPAEESVLWVCLSCSQARSTPGEVGGDTCVLTPKSHSFTCPRVLTSMLEGFTSVKGTKEDLEIGSSLHAAFIRGYRYISA